MHTRVAFLGPEGTYAEQAAFAMSKLENMHKPELVPCTGIHNVFEQISQQSCEFGVVPIENSVEGGVTSSLDALWIHPELFIHRALVLPIQHALLGNSSIEDISEVLSHPQALAQCRSWLSKNIPNAFLLPTSSTAEAVKMISGSKFRAAIASRKAIKGQEIQELAFPINDLPGNRTRFVLLHKHKIKSTGGIGSIAFSLHANKPGALLKALSCLADLRLNMSRIESRPSKRELGEYVFFIDLELPENLHGNYSKLKEKLAPYCEHLVDFGCYPCSEINSD